MDATKKGNDMQKIDETATEEVIEMALCEVPFLMLRPGVLYRFVEMPGCDACAAAAAPYKAPN